MSVAFQVTAEGENLDHALQNLKEIVVWLEKNQDAVETYYPQNGVAFPIKMPAIGSVCIENDEKMNGRLRLRRVGPPKPAFQKEEE